MPKRMTLEVLINNNWELVFCKNGSKIITTRDRRKAIHGDYMSLSYFKRFFPEHSFRIN
ncbi:MAG: hypothetical protein BWY70_01818 [Bacteroidetes bacterium ADurb.Bin408]|nr:MAG: hypothetical protein BWY70_01818 [Bacteroidetes bacterium ADurb.Bin408]